MTETLAPLSRTRFAPVPTTFQVKGPSTKTYAYPAGIARLLVEALFDIIRQRIIEVVRHYELALSTTELPGSDRAHRAQLCHGNIRTHDSDLLTLLNTLQKPGRPCACLRYSNPSLSVITPSIRGCPDTP